jgi:hypothetical protein
MKVGDLVRVFEPRACGGVPQGALGLIVENKITDLHDPHRHSQWVIMWLAGNKMDNGFHEMKESITYGHGLEVISESR